MENLESSQTTFVLVLFQYIGHKLIQKKSTKYKLLGFLFINTLLLSSATYFYLKNMQPNLYQKIGVPRNFSLAQLRTGLERSFPR